MTPTKVNWQEISKVGMPKEPQRIAANGLARQFLVRGEWSLVVARAYEDGSGFDAIDWTDTPQAWAVIEGF